MGTDISPEIPSSIERERLLRRLRQINRLSQDASPGEVINSILSTLLEELDCDRAWLLLGGPDSDIWSVPFEKTTPEFPGAYALGAPLPMDDGLRELLRVMYDTEGVLVSHDVGENHVPVSIQLAFQVEAQLAHIIDAKVGQQWSLGVHACKSKRTWSTEDVNFFREMAYRLGPCLELYLYRQRLTETETKLAQIFESQGLAHLECTQSGVVERVSPSIEEHLAYQPQSLVGKNLASLFYSDFEYTVVSRKLSIHGTVTSQEVNLVDKNGRAVKCLLNGQSHGLSLRISVRNLCKEEQANDSTPTEAAQSDSSVPASVFIASNQHLLQTLLTPWAGRHQVALKTVKNPVRLLSEIQNQKVDIVILDQSLVGSRLLSICSELGRQFPQLPRVVVGRLNSPRERAAAYNAGADDVLDESPDEEEFVSRLLSVWRRYRTASPHADTSELVVRGRLHLDPIRYEVSVDEQKVDLTTTEFGILLTLSRLPGRVLSREQIISGVWGDEFYGSPRTVDSHVRNLRTKLTRAVNDYSPIRAIRGVGYKFEEDEVESPASV